MRVMKTKINLVCVIAVIALGACSKSSDQQEDDAELESTDSANNIPSDESMGAEENFASSESDPSLENNSGITNDNLSNLTDGGNAAALADTSSGMINTPINSAITEAIPANTPANAGLPLTNSSTTALTNSTTTAPATTPTPVTTPMPNDGSGRVKYVASESLAVLDQPSSSAPVVGNLEKGDHPLVYADNANSGFVRLSNGKYIDAKTLSDTGVGRSRRSGNWK